MTTTGTPRELLHERVRLYVQVLLVIDVAAYVSDFVGPLLTDAVQPVALPEPFLYLRWTVTALLGTGWLWARFASPTRAVLIGLESAVTLGLSVVYGLLSLAFSTTPVTGPAFAVLGVLLLLVVRSALIPSPVIRTVVVGLTSFALVAALSREELAALDATTLDGLIFMSLAFVVATAVTSHVIYGLRRQVRDAMRLGQYELGRKLGEGGMGVVYQATHLMLRRPTAVKLLPTDAAAAETVARFEREVRQTSRLEHPNSVRIYDYGRTPQGQFYYAMEYLDGVTLSQLVELDGPLGDARVAHILTQAAHSLAEAHALGLVHRDVKPANIMLCDRGRIPDTVKVLDFGLVKVSEEIGDEITQTNTVLGTPQYMSPEAITDPDGVGPGADVYALGAVGYYLLTGQHVFEGKTVVEICARHLHDAPERPSTPAGRPIDPDLEALILECLEKDPEGRPADGASLAERLERLDLSGWSVERARAWWDGFAETREGAEPADASSPTQLAVDVHGRRAERSAP